MRKEGWEKKKNRIFNPRDFVGEATASRLLEVTQQETDIKGFKDSSAETSCDVFITRLDRHE